MSRSRAVFLAVVLFGCGSGLPENTATGPPPPPAPEPGSSITHTRMCACDACAEAACCKGSSDPDPVKSCPDYDFSQSGCGLAVESCQSRCYQRVWRVRLDQSCDQKRPAECC